MAVACATIPAGATFAPFSPALTPDVYTELLGRLQPKALLVPEGLDHPVRAVARRCGVAEIEASNSECAFHSRFLLPFARRLSALESLPFSSVSNESRNKPVRRNNVI
jgi:hypothetical protein